MRFWKYLVSSPSSPSHQHYRIFLVSSYLVISSYSVYLFIHSHCHSHLPALFCGVCFHPSTCKFRHKTSVSVRGIQVLTLLVSTLKMDFLSGLIKDVFGPASLHLQGRFQPAASVSRAGCWSSAASAAQIRSQTPSHSCSSSLLCLLSVPHFQGLI